MELTPEENALAARMGHAHSVKDNAWFVGVSPRRDPDIVVCTLFEAGEHGKLAGRLAAQVIEAFVNKQRRLDKNVLEVKKAAPPAPPATPAQNPATQTTAPKPKSKPKSDTVDVGAFWSDPASPESLGGKPVKSPIAGLGSQPLPALHAGHFLLQVSHALVGTTPMGSSPEAPPYAQYRRPRRAALRAGEGN